jgi:amidase
MRLDEYARCDGVEIAKLIKTREISLSEVTSLAIQAIDTLDPILNFMAYRAPQAELPGGPKADGSLLGVPFLTKEGSIAVRGQPWNSASRLGVSRVASMDSELTKRFRAAGLRLLGQSTSPEEGNAPTTESVLHGPTRNPWNTRYMPGGSSGGAAAAVASCAVPMAHATDGAGSIRIPAACCGLVGLKPSRGRTPGNHAMIFSPLCGHVVSRTVRDSAVMLDSINGPEVGGLYYARLPERPYREEVGRESGRCKIAFSTESPSGEKVATECVEAVKATARVLESAGHIIEEARPHYNWRALLAAFVDIYSYTHPYNVEILQRATSLPVGPNTRETCNLAMLEHARHLSMLDFARHMDELMAICRRVGDFFTTYDVFVTPVMTQSALPLGHINANAPGLTASVWFEQQFTHYAAFTPIYNATGQPAISLPLAHDAKHNLPVGVQLAGRHGEEGLLFRFAAQLEECLPWHGRRPPVSIPLARTCINSTDSLWEV